MSNDAFYVQLALLSLVIDLTPERYALELVYISIILSQKAIKWNVISLIVAVCAENECGRLKQ